jgi:transcriptional regulator with XRE-family HTH domain
MEDSSEFHVGLAIRSLREGKNLSLRQISQASGLSINAISKIERGDNSPTVASLHKIASALGVHITDLFIQTQDQITIYTPKDSSQLTSGNGLRVNSLGRGLPNQIIEPSYLEVQPGADSLEEPASHLGEEFVYCLAGEVIYLIGQERYILSPGDSLIFRASQPHTWQNRGKSTAKLLLIMENNQEQPIPHRYQTAG